MTKSICEVVEMAKANGYKAYHVDGDGYGTWAWLITPKGNVLCVHNAMWGTGVKFTFEYKGNPDTGRGCSCHDSTDEWDFGVKDVDVEALEKYEQNGYTYALNLKAKFYDDAEQFLDEERKVWHEKVVEL